MNLMIIFMRTILIYFVVLLVMRIMGKREIGKLSVFDVVISIMIAESAVLVIDDTKKPLLEGIIPMCTLVLIQIVMAYASLKSRKLRLLIDGKPSVLIEQGKINRKEMKKQKYSLDDLLQQLRENKIKAINDVEFAVLESSGKLSVIEKSDSEPAHQFTSLPKLLIMDGKVLEHNLKKINRNQRWLKNKIREHGLGQFDEVFFCSIDHQGKLFISKKDE